MLIDASDVSEEATQLGKSLIHTMEDSPTLIFE
jgi:hypothetical protein